MEIIGLDIIPGKTAPVVHASQYDVGRTIGVYLHEGSSAYTLTGAETVTASIRKPDGNVVVLNVANTSSDYVEIVTTEQATACHGANLCELKIEDGGDVIGTANFIMNVEKDPLEGGIASASEIDNLATQVAGFVATEVADQYDSANVIFDNTPTAGHGNGYAVTSEGVKNAIDALGTPTASDVSYDNTVSGLTATDVQDAIDEVNGKGLEDLSDTTITNPSSGQVLVWNGSKWVNNSLGKVEATSQVTFTEDTTGTNTRFYTKVGVLYIFYQGESKTHSTGDVLFTLPSGLRPTHQVYIPFVCNNTGYGNVTITTGGVCTVAQIANGSQAGRLYFSCAIPLI